jgi:hypothetical protein
VVVVDPGVKQVYVDYKGQQKDLSLTSTEEHSMEGSLMPRHKLGKTGLELSALGFGASPLGGAFGVGASAEEPSNWGLD